MRSNKRLTAGYKNSVYTKIRFSNLHFDLKDLKEQRVLKTSEELRK